MSQLNHNRHSSLNVESLETRRLLSVSEAEYQAWEDCMFDETRDNYECAIQLMKDHDDNNDYPGRALEAMVDPDKVPDSVDDILPHKSRDLVTIGAIHGIPIADIDGGPDLLILDGAIKETAEPIGTSFDTIGYSISKAEQEAHDECMDDAGNDQERGDCLMNLAADMMDNNDEPSLFVFDVATEKTPEPVGSSSNKIGYSISEAEQEAHDECMDDADTDQERGICIMKLGWDMADDNDHPGAALSAPIQSENAIDLVESTNVVGFVAQFDVEGAATRLEEFGGNAADMESRSMTPLFGAVESSSNVNIKSAPQFQGDINLDGSTNFADFLILSELFGREETSREQGDLNDDGKTNFSDFLILAEHFGSSNAAVVDALSAS